MWNIFKLCCLLVFCDLTFAKTINSTFFDDENAVQQPTENIELEIKYLKMQTENAQYRAEIGQLSVEVARLSKENFDLRHQENKRLTENTGLIVNQVETLNDNLHTLWRYLQPFKAMVAEQKNKMNLSIDEFKINEVDNNRVLPRSCAEIAPTNSGVYEIDLPIKCLDSFKVFCDADTDGGNWTVILKRFDGSVNFFHNWRAYREGFGNLDGEFFLGLDKIHQMTQYEPQELMFVLTDSDDVTRTAKYDAFTIGSADELYKLKELGVYQGDAGDSFSVHMNNKFSTYDLDNNNYNCANTHKGGWWYSDCGSSNLGGLYYNGVYSDNNFHGNYWYSINGFWYSLKSSVMMIRPTTK